MRHRGKIIKIVAIVLGRRRYGVRLALRHSIHDHDAVAQMNVIAGNADQPLHQEQNRRLASRASSSPGLMNTTMSPRFGSR